MQHASVEDAVIHIVAEVAERPREQVKSDTNIFLELGVDSLGVVAIFVELKRQFRIAEPANTQVFRELNTPAKWTEYVLSQLAGAN